MEILPQLLAVVGVLALLAVTLWWLKGRGIAQIGARLPRRFLNLNKRTRSGLLERADVLQLSPAHTLSLIRMADRAILIGTSPAGFHLVESAPWKTVQPKDEAHE